MYKSLAWLFVTLPILACAGEYSRLIHLKQDRVDGQQIKAQPGDVIGIEPGRRSTLWIEGVHGTKERPITIINAGGLVEVENADRGFAIILHNCKFVRFTGTGDPKTQYGFRAKTSKAGMHTFSVGFSWDFEVDHVEISGAGFAGFNIKSEPVADGSTNRDTYTMTNAVLHDNFVHDTSSEGFYVGHTFYNGYSPPEAKGKTLVPHVIKGLRIYNNICRDTGAEGMQIGSAVEDVKIYGNLIENPGKTPFDKWQNNGVQIGVGTTGEFYNNTIINAPAQGIILWGKSDNSVYNNVVVNAGGCGIYCMDKGVPDGPGYRFVNNTIINPGGDGIFLNLEKAPRADVRNNIIVKSGKGTHLVKTKVKCDVANNLCAKSVEEVGFVDPSKNDFRLLPASKARNAGVPCAELEITFDCAMQPRPKAGACDIGAFQYADPNQKPSKENGKVAAKSEPTPARPAPPKPTLKEGVLAQWDAKLVERLKASFDKGGKHRVTLVAQRRQFTAVSMDKNKVLVLQGDDGKLDAPFAVLSLPEKTDLAQSLGRGGEAEDRALAAFYLLLAGRTEEAEKHLEEAPALRDGVRAALGLQ